MAYASESDSTFVGDAAGEHRMMERGRYDAWAYVVFAFAFEIAIIGYPIYASVESLLGGRYSADGTWMGLAAGGTVGFSVAFATFWNRWRCIEAFSSRFCSGLANLSMFYVPIIALGYAAVRGLQKLAGR